MEKTYIEIKAKCRTTKKQLKAISYIIIENGISEDETVVKTHEKIGTKVEETYLKCKASFATYQERVNLENERLTGIGQVKALKEIVYALESNLTKDKSHG